MQVEIEVLVSDNGLMKDRLRATQNKLEENIQHCESLSKTALEYRKTADKLHLDLAACKVRAC